MPEKLPYLGKDELEKLNMLPFPDLAREILSKFISAEDIPHDELDKILKECYRSFEDPTVVPVKQSKSGVFVAELFHGPTCSFKDLGQQILIRPLNCFSKKGKSKRTLLVSTILEIQARQQCGQLQTAKVSIFEYLSFRKVMCRSFRSGR